MTSVYDQEFKKKKKDDGSRVFSSMKHKSVSDVKSYVGKNFPEYELKKKVKFVSPTPPDKTRVKK